MSQLATHLTSEDLVPHDNAAEVAVLASVIMDTEAMRAVQFLTADDFYFVRHGWIWEAVRAVSARHEAVDEVTVVSELEARGRLSEVGGAAYIIGLLTQTSYAVNVESYGRIVHRMATRRRLIEAAQEVARAAHSDDTEIAEVLGRAQAAVDAAADHHIGADDMNGDAYSVASEVIDQVNDWNLHPTDIRGMETGLSPLDVAVSGVEIETLTYLAGRPGSGKSALLDQMARGLAEHGNPVLLFSLEMSKRAVMLRMACQLAALDSRAVRNGRLTPIEHSRLMTALGKISSLPIDILPLTSPTMAEIQARTRQYVRRNGVRVVMIDTINRARPSYKVNSTYERMTVKSNEAADMAHDIGLSVAVICAVQMSRASEQRSNKQPELSDLRDSGELEQDADGVWGIYRPGYYEPEDPQKAHLAELHILKHREGEAGGMVELFWEPTWPGFARLQRKSVSTNSTFERRTQDAGAPLEVA